MATEVRKLDGECTPSYQNGWDYAQWWLGKGGSAAAGGCGNWPEGKANGFYERLKLERDFRESMNGAR